MCWDYYYLGGSTRVWLVLCENPILVIKFVSHYLLKGIMMSCVISTLWVMWVVLKITCVYVDNNMLELFIFSIFLKWFFTKLNMTCFIISRIIILVNIWVSPKCHTCFVIGKIFYDDMILLAMSSFVWNMFYISLM